MECVWFEIRRVIWNHKYDFRPKLHDPKFNCYFITFFLKSHNLIALIQVFKDIFYWLSKKVQFVNLCMILRPNSTPLSSTIPPGEAPPQGPAPYLLYTFFFRGTPFVYLLLEIGTPFISLPFYIPEAWKRYPFRAELPRIGHYREYPSPGLYHDYVSQY